MNKKKVLEITEKFEEMYPNAKPALEFNSVYELLVAVILSAQCTDKRVNQVTRELFKVASTPQQMIELGQQELEKYIYSCGFYHAKAQHIISASEDIVNKYGGNVPSTREEMQKLAGVGRKTANVVYSVAFNGDAIAVDTHVFRVSARIGLASHKNPLQTEQDLMKVIPKEHWSRMHHCLIYHGREICDSRKPKCGKCGIRNLCEYKEKED